MRKIAKSMKLDLLILPISISAILFFVTFIQFNQLNNIEGKWTSFQLEVDKREVYISGLKDLLGYGGQFITLKIIF